MLDKLKTAIVLVIIGALSGITIYGVNLWTEEDIRFNRIDLEEGYYKELFNLEEDTKINTVKSPLETVDGLTEEIELLDIDNNLIGYIYKVELKNSYGNITVLVGITSDGIISNVAIASTENTVTFVQTIKSKYLINFANQDTTDIQIDDSTGASYTYGSVVEAVVSASNYFEESRGE